VSAFGKEDASRTEELYHNYEAQSPTFNRSRSGLATALPISGEAESEPGSASPWCAPPSQAARSPYKLRV
jgi:hypothetical protein